MVFHFGGNSSNKRRWKLDDDKKMKSRKIRAANYFKVAHFYFRGTLQSLLRLNFKSTTKIYQRFDFQLSNVTSLSSQFKKNKLNFLCVVSPIMKQLFTCTYHVQKLSSN